MTIMAHVLEKMGLETEKLIKKIKDKYKTDKKLARQLIAGARETADYSCEEPRWSMTWYITYIRELENRA
jgi:hypothetical protein